MPLFSHKARESLSTVSRKICITTLLLKLSEKFDSYLYLLKKNSIKKKTNRRVTKIDLHFNFLSDSLPSSIGNLTKLTDLNLELNGLTRIPSSIGNLVNLTALYLGVNQLTGNIPSSIGNLVKLHVNLDLEYNQLSGTIPSSLGNLKKLNYLWLFNNQLTGNIPCSIGNLVNLEELDLNNNQLSGRIPSSLKNASLLRYLFLSYNHFTFDGMEFVARAFPEAVYGPQKNIVIHQNGNTLSVHAGGTLSNNTYKWFKCQGTSPVLVATIKGDSVFHPLESGKYRVKVLNSVATQLQLYSPLFDYTASANTFVASPENELQQYSKPNIFSVYPNPVKDVLYVEMNDGSVSLINQAGKMLLTKTIHVRGMINVTGLPSGLYYLKNMQTGEVKKVVISR